MARSNDPEPMWPEPKRAALTDEDAYRVAQLMCEDLLAANEIARRMYPDLYSSGRAQDKSRAIMRVKHLARRATRAGMLRLDRPVDERLARDLRAHRIFGDVTFHVADDRGNGGSLGRSEPVYREAARVLAAKIEKLLLEKAGPIVIANAGGPTLSRVVEHLPDLASEWAVAARRLQFVSLNAARDADAYHLSANFIAVRMSQVLGGSHIASLRIMPTSVASRYADALAGVDLVLCGVGTRKGFLSRWLKGVFDRELLPPHVVGDICLLPIDKNGQAVVLRRPPAAMQRVNEELRPAMSHSALVSLAQADKVLAVAAYPDAYSAAASKVSAVRAMLGRPLAKTCVLGRSLAQSLLASLDR